VSGNVVYGSARVRTLDTASHALAEEIAERLAPMRTEGFRGSFTVSIDDGPILVIDMNLRRRVQVK
jgi:hypothetical protein